MKADSEAFCNGKRGPELQLKDTSMILEVILILKAKKIKKVIQSSIAQGEGRHAVGAPRATFSGCKGRESVIVFMAKA